MAPPLVVLSTAYVLKEQVLEDDRTPAYNRASLPDRVGMSGTRATAHAEEHPQWSQFYANALRDELRKANYRRQETLAALTTADWRMLVYRELQAEQWYVEPETNGFPIPGGG